LDAQALDDHFEPLPERTLSFRTESGLRYVYDDVSGVILPANAGHALGPGPLGPEDGSLEARLARRRQAVESRAGSPRPWTPERVRAETLTSPSLQTTLIVTERCTLRCRYCVYTGTYEHSRTHSSADMPVEVALKAVDFLVAAHREKEKHNPGRTPALGFYGGEPLLRFDLIRRVIEYAERSGLTFSYSVTTNGTINDDDVVTYLVDKGFNVAVSLDGPPSEHDRNRVFPDGRGSAERVYGFLRKLRAARQRLGRQGDGQTPFVILCCTDRATDFQNVCGFFDSDPALFADVSARVSMIYPFRTSYYDGWTEEDLRRAERTGGQLWPLYSARLGAGALPRDLGFRDWMFGMNLRNLLYGLAMEGNPLRGTCVPGSRTAVDPSGRLHICERVNNNYPIGNLETGLDSVLISDLLNTAQNYFEERCRLCAVRRLCGACFSHLLVDGGTRLEIPDQYCSETPVGLRRNLSTLFSILEKNPGCASLLMPTYSELERDRIFNG
jgi:uncharacterized protein